MSVAPPALTRASNLLKRHPQRPRSYQFAGIVGDANHTYGYHCGPDRIGGSDYSMQTARDKRGAQLHPTYSSAWDLSFNASDMKLVTRRLLNAARARDPRMRGVKEFCGTLNGSQTYPWDLTSNSSEGVDSWDHSHLTHVHISFYRDTNDDFEVIVGVVAVICGVDAVSGASGGSSGSGSASGGTATATDPYKGDTTSGRAGLNAGFGDTNKPDNPDLSLKEARAVLRKQQPLPKDVQHTYTGLSSAQNMMIADDIVNGGGVSVNYYNQPFARGLLPRDAYKNILFRNTYWTVRSSKTTFAFERKKSGDRWFDFSAYITDAHLSMAWDAITELTIEMEDPELNIWRTFGVKEGQPCSYNDFPFRINAVTLTDGNAGKGGLSIVLRPAGVQFLKDAQGPKVDYKMSASEWVLRECASAGIGCIVQNSPQRPSIARDVTKKDEVDEGEPKSSWTTMQRLAQEEGYMLFEAYNVIYFINPDYLFKLVSIAPVDTIEVYYPQADYDTTDAKLNALSKELTQTYYVGRDFQKATAGKGKDIELGLGAAYSLSELGFIKRKLHETIGVPNVSHTVDEGPRKTTQVTFEAPLEEANYYHVGRRVIVRRLDFVQTELEPLLVSGVDYSLAGTGTVSVTASSPPKMMRSYNAKALAQKDPNDKSHAVGVVPPGKYGKVTLNAHQAQNATDVIAACKSSRGITDKDTVIALITCLTESTLHRYTNPQIPGTLNVPNDGPPPPGGAPLSDHSCGLYQQRDSWGSPKQRMDAVLSTRLFLHALVRQRNRANRQEGEVAQAVQVSAFPERYQGYVPSARAILAESKKHPAAPSPRAGGGGAATPQQRKKTRSTASEATSEAVSQIGLGRRTEFMDIADLYWRPPGQHVSKGYNPLTEDDACQLVKWAIRQVGGPSIPNGFQNQRSYIRGGSPSVPSNDALRLRGCIFFDAKGLQHTGFTIGDGKNVVTIGSKRGVHIARADPNWEYYKYHQFTYDKLRPLPNARKKSRTDPTGRQRPGDDPQHPTGKPYIPS